MKTIKTSIILKDFKGEALKLNKEDLTLGDVISQVMGGRVSNPTLGWVLGKQFAIQEEVDLKAEEVVFIKEELTKSEWNAVVIGQVIEILESKEEVKA